ncbi:DUF302 domain-containing protein [Ilumatobacter sp.]|uniref:DUF302 domain-containing protein n=1 Tax=Ilumatobacter sp. TaxID=1967498 RepID=UPI003752476E
MDFTRRIELDTSYDDTIGRVTDALKDQGFGILTEIDVRQTLKDKLDVDIEPQIILGACNPGLAHRALEVDPRIGALLPCNVVVRTENGRTVVEALDPKLIAEVPDNPALVPIAEEAGQRIQAALDALANP